MSQRNRIARVTGMNTTVAGQVPAPGSFYSADGAPGATAGPATGFSVAFGIRLPAKIAGPLGTPWIDPTAEEAALANPGITLPALEFLFGTYDFGNPTGWALLFQSNAVNSDVLFIRIGDATILVPMPERTGEYIGLFSFVPDDEAYGGAGVTLAALALNGQLAEIDGDASAFAYTPSGRDFSIGGTTDPTYLADDPAQQGGAVYTEITSVWTTEGIPTSDEANAFFEASMDAGIVIPQAWAPARTTATPNPATPSEPTGNYWTAAGVDPNGTLGSVWADKLGNGDLTRVSPAAPGAPPVEGDLKVSARQPGFPFIPNQN